MSEFCTILKNEIENSGYSIYSISKEINYDRATLTNCLNGKRKIPKDVFMKLLGKLNVTETTRKNLIKFYHADSFNGDFENFEMIKQAFATYQKITSYEKNNLMGFIPCDNIFDKTTDINGEVAVLDVVKNIILCELQNDKPSVLFNLNLDESEIFYIIQAAYNKAKCKDGIKNIVSFSVNEADNTKNFTTFVGILPLILKGYLPYYCFTEHITESELSLLFPYYVITSDTALIITGDFKRAILTGEKSVVKAYKREFELKCKKCKRFKCEPSHYLEMPAVIKSCIASDENPDVDCLNSTFCSMPFLTREHLLHMFGENFNNDPVICDRLIGILSDFYSRVDELISFCPVESIMEFVKTGIESHICEKMIKPLSIEQRIEVLTAIRKYIEDGGKYYFVERSNFFCNNLTFNLMSDSKIIFFNFDQRANEYMYTITTPNGLLSSLRPFFRCLEKSCYNLSKEKSIAAIDRGIEYARSLLEKKP